MFSWLTKQRKPVETQPDRDIFEFWDGAQMRRIDPLQVWYKFWATEDIQGLMDKAARGEAESVQELTAVTRELFCVPPYKPDVGGMTELEVQRLLMNFLEYCGELKKKHGLLPLPWQMLAPSISSDPSTTPPAAESSSSPSMSPSGELFTVCTPSPQLSAGA